MLSASQCNQTNPNIPTFNNSTSYFFRPAVSISVSMDNPDSFTPYTLLPSAPREYLEAQIVQWLDSIYYWYVNPPYLIPKKCTEITTADIRSAISAIEKTNQRITNEGIWQELYPKHIKLYFSIQYRHPYSKSRYPHYTFEDLHEFINVIKSRIRMNASSYQDDKQEITIDAIYAAIYHSAFKKMNINPNINKNFYICLEDVWREIEERYNFEKQEYLLEIQNQSFNFKSDLFGKKSCDDERLYHLYQKKVYPTSLAMVVRANQLTYNSLPKKTKKYSSSSSETSEDDNATGTFYLNKKSADEYNNWPSYCTRPDSSQDSNEEPAEKPKFPQKVTNVNTVTQYHNYSHLSCNQQNISHPMSLQKLAQTKIEDDSVIRNDEMRKNYIDESQNDIFVLLSKRAKSSEYFCAPFKRKIIINIWDYLAEKQIEPNTKTIWDELYPNYVKLSFKISPLGKLTYHTRNLREFISIIKPSIICTNGQTLTDELLRDTIKIALDAKALGSNKKLYLLKRDVIKTWNNIHQDKFILKNNQNTFFPKKVTSNKEDGNAPSQARLFSPYDKQ